MADRVEVYDVTIPAGTAKSAPAVTPLTFDPGYLRRWSVTIPAGVSALAGFRLAYAGQQLIPNNAGAWITGNGEPITDDASYDFVGSQWTLVGYNTDIYDHTFHLRLFVDEISNKGAQVDTGPDVLPVTITAGTVDLTPITDTPLDLPADTPPDAGGDVTPLDIPVDTVTLDTGTDVAPLDLPDEAPPVADSTPVTDTVEDA